MSVRLLTASAPRTSWITASAWAAVAHVFFQIVGLALAADGRASGWGVATMVQGILTALLAVGAFRRNVVALTLLGVLGSVRVVSLIALLAEMAGGTAAPVIPRVAIELAVAIPIALLWIAGAISALNAMRSRAVLG